MEDSSARKRRASVAVTHTGTGVPEDWSNRPTDRSPREVIAMFNDAKSADKGIKAMVEAGYLDGTPADTAHFLIANDGKLKLEYVGDYVGGEKEHHKETLAAILEVMDFSEVPLDSALRRFIALIKLPGESQKIDRILTIFATRYLECNPTAFDHEDTVMILCF